MQTGRQAGIQSGEKGGADVSITHIQGRERGREGAWLSLKLDWLDGDESTSRTFRKKVL